MSTAEQARSHEFPTLSGTAGRRLSTPARLRPQVFTEPVRRDSRLPGKPSSPGVCLPRRRVYEADDGSGPVIHEGLRIRNDAGAAALLSLTVVVDVMVLGARLGPPGPAWRP